MAGVVVEQRWPAVAMATIVAVLLIAPRTSAGLAFALAALPLAWADRRQAGIKLPLPTLGLLPGMVLVLGAYMAFSIILSLDRLEAAGKTLLFLGLAGAIGVAAAAFAESERARLAEAGRAAVLAFAIVLAFLLLEEVLGHAVKNGLYRVLPFLAPDAKHVRSVGDAVLGATYLTNRSIAALVVMLVPITLIARTVLAGGLKSVATVGLPVLAGATALASQHESSQLGLAAALVVLGLGLVRFRAALWLVAAAWVAAVALVVPVVHGLYAMNLHLSPSLPFSARARVILWNYTATQVPQRLMLGVGLASTRMLDERRVASAVTLPGHVYPQRTGPHAHNIYLQTWYELGLVGAALLMALGLALIGTISRLSEAARPYALATFAASAMIGAFSWGLWQPWFMAIFAVAAILMMHAEAIVRSGGRDPAPAV